MSRPVANSSGVTPAERNNVSVFETVNSYTKTTMLTAISVSVTIGKVRRGGGSSLIGIIVRLQRYTTTTFPTLSFRYIGCRNARSGELPSGPAATGRSETPHGPSDEGVTQ